MYAVVRVSGFQYMVKEGDVVTVPRQPGESGDTVRLDDVLMLRTKKDVVIGRPRVADSFVEAVVVDHPRASKITVFKFRRRENYRRKRGHRQPLTRLQISKIHHAS